MVSNVWIRFHHEVRGACCRLDALFFVYRDSLKTLVTPLGRRWWRIPFWGHNISGNAPLFQRALKERLEATLEQRSVFYILSKMNNNIYLPAEQRAVSQERRRKGALALLNEVTTALFMVALFTTPGTVPNSLQLIFLPAFGLVVLFLLLCLVFPRLRAQTPRAWLVSLSVLPALLITSLLSWPAVSESAPNATWFPASPASTVSAPAGQMTTLEYCHPGGDPLAMDLSEPAATFARPVPVVFYMHGGEGLIGNRQLSGPDGVYFTHLRSNLLAHGFAVGSIDYRFPPLYGMLDQVVDAKCAVRFLRAHANELGINPQRIGVYGVSEGGYLASMLGLSGPDAGFEKGQYLNQSSRVQAAVDMWGPADLTDWRGTPSWVYTLGEGLGISRQGTALRADQIPANARKN